MKLLIDGADVEKIRQIWEDYPVDGVSTNPSILAKTGRNPYDVLQEIRAVIGPEADLHVQVISSAWGEMLPEAERIRKVLGENTLVKIPVTPQGLRAIKCLSARGVRVTATAIYTPMQAFLAGKAGAAFAAPYVNRIDNLGCDGVETAKTIHDLYQKNGLSTQVLAASFKNSQQVLELAKYGVGAATVGPAVFDVLLQNPCVTAAVDVFAADFQKLCGPGKTMADC